MDLDIDDEEMVFKQQQDEDEVYALQMEEEKEKGEFTNALHKILEAIVGLEGKKIPINIIKENIIPLRIWVEDELGIN